MTKQTILSIPDFALVIVLADEKADARQLIQKMDGISVVSTENTSYDALKAAVYAHLTEGRSAILHHTNSAENTRRSLYKWARSAGAASVVIRVGTDTEQISPSEPYGQLFILPRDQISSAVIERTRMSVDLRHLKGPFDIVGDLHGCLEELKELLVKLGYATWYPNGIFRITPHPDGRRLCFLGDLTDRGPKNLSTLQLVHHLHTSINAITVLGNHDHKLMRWLRGRNVRQAAGLQMTVAEFEAEKVSAEYRADLAEWLESLSTHHVLDEGRLIIAHAGLAERFHGRESAEAEAFALYGEKSGQSDTDGYPLTRDWAADYRGNATIVHGHVVTSEPRHLNKVVSIDTGCVFGGALTAYRYPENEYVSVPARAEYFKYQKRQPATDPTE